MECNSKIFICYRNNNVDIAKKLYEYINGRNMEENLNFKKIWFSNGEVECNYLYDALDGIQTYNHIIFLIDQHFTKGFFLEDGQTINENCITAKEILSIAKKLQNEFKDKDYLSLLPHMYCINVGEKEEGTLSQNGSELVKYLSYHEIDLKVINLFLKLGENHIVKNNFLDDDYSIVFERVLDKIIQNINIEMSFEHYMMFYENKQVYKTLPEVKLVNCIYAKGAQYDMNSTESAKTLIDDFKALFIDKKVYKYHINDDTSDRVYDFKKNILKEDSILIGNAGCGKSTLLFHSYIELVEDLEKYKCLPIFVDLNMVTNQLSLKEAIEKVARFYLPNKFNLINIYKELALKGYSCLLILDSLDESKADSIQSQLASLRQSDLFLNFTQINYKICVGLRVGRFDALDDDIKNEFRKYSIMDFDKSDVDLYIERLIQLNRIELDQFESIKLAVELLTYTDKINPFLLSMIVQPYVNDHMYKPESFKMIDLLYTSVIALTKKVNLNRGDLVKDIDQRSLMTIGIYGVLGNIDHMGNPYNLYNVDSSFSNQIFEEDKHFISKSTYLINKEGMFYQKIFSDFFAAKYIYDYLGRNIINEFKFIDILKKFYSSFKYKEFFEFIILLADKDTERYKGNINFRSEKINKILDLMLEHMNDEILYYNLSSMINIVIRYSSKKLIKDALPVELFATYHPAELLTFLLEKYFIHLSAIHRIDYGYFYGIITKLNRYDLVLTAIYNILDKVKEEESFRMLSIFRDAYLILKYNGQKGILQCNYPKGFDKAKMASIYKAATNHFKYPRVIDMPLRELLNATFYSHELLFNGVQYIDFSKKNPNIDLKYTYFPYIYNLELFVTNPIYSENKKFKIVDEDDHLFFHNHENNSAISILCLDQIEKETYKLDSDITSLFIYTEEHHKVLPNCIFNRHNILSLHLSEGIEEIAGSSFMKSELLRNVFFPNSLKIIHPFAFCHCDRLEEFRLPEGITELGESAIEDCPLIDTIVFPRSLKKIGNYLFEQCSSLKNVDFQGNYIELMDGTFVGCQSLESIEAMNLNKNLNTLPMLCFSSASKLRKADFTLFNKLEIIKNHCFYDCTSLEEVLFPSSLKKIGMCVFYGCNALRRIVFRSIPVLSSESFAGIKDFHKMEFIICGERYTFVNKEELNQKILSMGGSCIEDRFVGGFAFELKKDGTYNLEYSFNRLNKKITLLNSSYFSDQGIRISSFTIGALGDHNFLNDIILDENLKESAEWMFEDCQALFNVKLGKTKINVIEKHMFENCDALTEITLPATITEIKEYAFENCTNLATIHFIRNCFDSCNYKKDEEDISLCLDIDVDVRRQCIYNEIGVVYIPCNINFIGDYAFHNCKSIKTMYYNSKTTYISPLATYETDCKLIKLDNDEVFE